MASTLRFDNWEDSNGTPILDGTNLSLPSSAMPTGSILQVVTVAKTDTFSASLGGGAFSSNVTGLDLSITPTSATSKIFVFGQLSGARSDNFAILAARLMRDTTAIGIGTSVSSRAAITSIAEVVSASVANMATIPVSFLDSPATTSAITYGIQLTGMSSTTTTVYLNRSADDGDIASYGRSISTLTAMEVAG